MWLPTVVVFYVPCVPNVSYLPAVAGVLVATTNLADTGVPAVVDFLTFASTLLLLVSLLLRISPFAGISVGGIPAVDCVPSADGISTVVGTLLFLVFPKLFHSLLLLLLQLPCYC
jgi:hypothetical protein